MLLLGRAMVAFPRTAQKPLEKCVRLLQTPHGVRSFAHFPGSNADSGISSAPRCGMLNCRETTTHREAADDVPTCDAIIVLAAISSRSFPRVARGGRAAEREAGAVRDGTRPRPGRSIDAALAWVARPSAGRARGFGSGFCRQGGLRRSDDQPIGRPSEGGQDVATSV